MKRQRLLSAVFTTAFMLSGCTSLSLDSDLLSTPKATGDLAAIQTMIEQDAKGSYSLIYPIDGAYKNGIIRYDIDNDGTEEAIALYKTADLSPRLLVAEDNNGYQLVGSAKMHSDVIKDISFTDIDSNGTHELLIRYGDTPSASALEMFSIGNGVKVSAAAKGFSDFLLGDFDDSSVSDILIIDAPGAQNTQAHLMVYDNGKFTEKSACGVDSEISSYVSLRYGSLSEDISGAVIDGQLPDGTYTTQLLYYDSAAQMLVNPLLQNESYSQSRRTAAVSAADIDGDGVIEIPACALMDHTKNEDESTVCSLVHWCGYVPELMELSTKQTAILCERLDFALYLTPERLSVVTARYTADNAVTLSQLNYNKNAEPVPGKELLTIKRYEKSGFDSSLTAEAKLYENDQYVYTYILPEKSPFNHEEIENSFKSLEADNAVIPE